VRVAVIDLGSNSVILSIAERINNHIKALYEESIITRIGRNIEKHRNLNPDSRNNTIDVLKKYKEIADNLVVDIIICFATDALRDAEDSQDFLDEVYEKTGIEIKIISGEEEAELTFYSVKIEFGDIGNKFFSIDAGGGSVELANGTDKNIEFANSLKIGAVRIKNKFRIQDNIDHNTFVEVNRFIKSQLPKIIIDDGYLTVATGGTITTLQAINLGLEKFEHEKVHKSKITYEQMRILFDYLNGITFTERLNIPCLDPGRADIIHIGALIFLSIMEKYNIKNMFVSNRGVRWGFIYKLLD